MKGKAKIRNLVEKRIPLLSYYEKKEYGDILEYNKTFYLKDFESVIYGEKNKEYKVKMEDIKFSSTISFRFNTNINREHSELNLKINNKVYYHGLKEKKTNLNLEGSQSLFGNKFDYTFFDVDDLINSELDEIVNNVCKYIIEFDEFINRKFNINFF